MRLALYPVLCPLLCLLNASCQRDPIDAPGTWHAPEAGFNSNDRNLRAMLVNPGDLRRGEGQFDSPAVIGAAAARRELTNRRYPLTNADVMLNGAGSQQAGQPNLQMQPNGAGAAPTE